VATTKKAHDSLAHVDVVEHQARRVVTAVLKLITGRVGERFFKVTVAPVERKVDAVVRVHAAVGRTQRRQERPL
jgi:hypothetical protein